MTQLAEDYFHLSPSGAKWDHTQNLIYYIAGASNDLSLKKVEPNNGEIQKLDTSSPIAVLDVVRGTIILGNGTCNPFGNCVYSDLTWIADQGTEINSVSLDDSILLPCQTGSDFVYSLKDENGSVSLHIRPHGQDQETVFWTWTSEYADCTWSPDGTQLAVIVIDRFWYSGSIQEYYFQLLFPNTNEVLDLSYLNAPLDHLSWSPDGRYSAFSGTELNEDQYQLEINIFELNSYTVSRFNQFEQFKSENYISIPKLFWAP